jgi:hypothetical protein
MWAKSKRPWPTSKCKAIATRRIWPPPWESEPGPSASKRDALFPNHASTLKVADPELIELFDNWAFDKEIVCQAVPYVC